MIAPARLAAYTILRTLASGRSDLATATAQARASLSDERDRALASEIASGVQRWQLTLDHVIAQVAKRPAAKMDPEVLEVLRIATYQLLHLTRVPASAVVDDAVTMTRKFRKGSASGFVNAVLRSVSRARTHLPLPPHPGADAPRGLAVDYLTTALSHPRWLAERWYDRLGFAVAERWMQFNNQPAPLTLRANRLTTDVDVLEARFRRHDVEVQRGRFAPDALLVEHGAALRGASMPADLYVVQDEASQLVTLLTGERPGPRVLDTCASPGGKTTAIAATLTLAGGGIVVACDVREKRMALLASTVRATGAQNVRLAQADLTVALPFGAVFDTVLVDAPCSGLGTLRRDPDIKWRRHEADVVAMAMAQKTMLAHAAAVVAPGGRLIYATCSTEPEENEQVVSHFLSTHDGFRAVHAATVDPRLTPVVDAEGHLRTSPDQHGLEGFFGAVFERPRHL